MREPTLTYGRYLRVPELLSLQTCLSSPSHHDEALFIVIHQVYELWFKLLLHELDSAVVHLDRDRVPEAVRLLRRGVEVQRLLIQQVRILETMRPQDFLGFRDLLNPASGFQSVQFRELEFVLGLKQSETLDKLECEPHERERLRARLKAPSLGDVFDALLSRRGLGRRPGHAPSGELSRSEPWRLEALKRLYSQADSSPDLLALCEVLIEMDECLSLWRFHHVQMVERMIGARRGTGGSEGVAYLQSTLSKRAFPELWHVRTQLG